MIAGAAAPACVCVSFPEGGGHTVACATPPSAEHSVLAARGSAAKGNRREYAFGAEATHGVQLGPIDSAADACRASILA